MVNIILSSFAVIFLAEMGDKTQLMTMSFSAKYGISTTLKAIFIAILINSFIAVAVASFIFSMFHGNIIQVISCIVFIGFGVWNLINQKDKDEKKKEEKVILNPLVTIAAFFIISEAGDKTQIATMLLSIQTNTAVPVFIGASAGLFAANIIGALVGGYLGKKMPEKMIKIVSAIVFILIGIAGLIKIYIA
ncbi:MAG: TMEM165/GDT1 family protein [Elusimicrobiota bacterium]|jgi:putative Ca2+/H+ antiporter (TMEM165/GDT1 family)|nr:TMEM165/GDT1 family protein [Elusimicrobiota bacterium]